MGQIRPLYNVRSVISRAAQGLSALAAVALALSAAHCAHAALPAGYVQLKSITSTGSQYIQTGMLPTTSTTVEMDFNTGPNGTDTMFFGQAWNASQYLFCKKSDKYAFYGSGGQVSPLNPNTDAHVSITAENKFIIDYGSVAYTSTVSRAVSSSKFNIFADCDGGHKGSWTLYSLKIWNGGTAMRDFVPALRESDNAVGLYDVVGNTFYANSGSGSFGAGIDGIAGKSLQWSKGSYTPASWTADPDNILKDATCGTSALARLADGKLEKFSTSGGDGNISNSQVVEWTLSSPQHVKALNVYSWWNDNGRDGINIQKVEVKTAGYGIWFNIGASAVSQDAGTSANYVKLTESSGGTLADVPVTALRITFGSQDNNKTCYAEIELVCGFSSDMLQVSSSTGIDCSEPSPAYGVTNGLSDGATLSVSCGQAVWTNAEGIAYFCKGWKLYNTVGNVVSNGTETSFAYTHPDPAAYRKLEWQWEELLAIFPIPLQTIAFGESATPDVVVSNRLTGAVLEKDTDYTLSYENNDFTGNATVTVAGIGEHGDLNRTVDFKVYTSFRDDSPVLPEGYTALDHFYVNNSSLTTTGSGVFSWIDTGVIPKGDWTINIDFAVGSLYKGDIDALFCARNGTSTDSAMMTFYHVRSYVENSEMVGCPRIDFGDSFVNYATGINCYDWAGTHSFQYHRGTAYIDGNSYLTLASTNFTASGRLTLFATYWGSSTATPADGGFSGAFYGAKFYDGAGALQMHLVPCVRESDGAIGVYNLGATSPGFMPNSGTAPFTLDAPGREMIVNGGFETRTSIDATLNNGKYGYLNRAYNNGQARTSAWFGGTALSVASSDFNVPSSFLTGTYCSAIGGNNLSQTFLSDRTVKAKLTFKYMHRQSYNPGVAVDLIVSLDGVEIDRIAVPVNSSTVYNYSKEDIFIPYSAEGHTLKFSRSGSGDYYIDNISLKITEVYDYNDFVCLLPSGATEGTRLAPAEPPVAVTNTIDGTLLVAGTDYDVVYSNNLVSNHGYAIVTGKGAYAGKKAVLPYAIDHKLAVGDFEGFMYVKPADGKVTSALSNFPILIRLSAARQPGFDPAECGEGGEGLRFVLADGTLLAHEIDYWNPEGESTVWVNIPSLTASTIVYILWSPVAGYTPPAIAPSETWPAFAGVWHFSEESGIVHDSSGNGYHSTNDGGGTVSNVNAKVGLSRNTKGTQFNTSVTSLIASSNAKPISNVSKFTISGWMHSTVNISNYAMMMGKGAWQAGGWYTAFNKTPTQFTGIGSGTTHSYQNLPSSVYNNWAYITLVFNDATCSIYENGALVGSPSVNKVSNSTHILNFVNGFTGRIDEFRIYNGVETAAYIAAEYKTQNDGAFLTYGAIGVRSFSVAAIPETAYTLSGSAKPAVTVTDDATGAALVEGDNYTVAYLDNTMGYTTGRVIVTGYGVYDGCVITNTFATGLASCDLDADTDWTAYANVGVSASGVIDLMGHTLTLASLSGSGTITDSVGGGRLVMDIPAGKTVTLNTALTGALKLVKTGAGVLVASKAGQTYTGGTDVLGGVLRTGGGGATDGWLGPNTSTTTCHVYVGPNGILDPAGSSGWGYHKVALDGGMVSNTVARTGTSSVCFNPVLSTTGDVALVTMGEYSWTSAGGDLRGGTLTVEVYNYLTAYSGGWIWSNGTVHFKRGGWLNTSRGAIDIRTCDLRQTGGALNVANALSVRDYYCSYSGDSASGTAALNVYGTFTPASTYFYGPTMQNGSAIDLSAKSGAWSTTSPNKGNHNGNKTVKFAANATVAIGLGERPLAAGDKVVAWTSEPSTVVFTNADWYLKRRADGVYVNGTQAPGAAILPMSVPVQYIRGGAPAEPDLHLVNAATGEELAKGTDYTVFYSDNAAPGVATVTVTGAGTYAGLAFTDEFTIAESFAASAAVPPEAYMDGRLDWTGVAVTDVVTGGALVEGTNYDYDYTLSGSTATATITGRGDYAGTTVEYTFEIAPKAYFTDFRSKIEITVGEGMVTTELANFPALVRLSAASIEGFNPADCGEGGSELAFLAEDGGELLPCEVDYWNPEGESTVWVKVPSLAADTKLYAVFGRKDGRAAIASNPKRVWGDYVGVWHFSEASGIVRDSSVNGWNSTDNGGGTVSNLNSKVGLARNTAGTQFTIGVMNLAASGNAKPLTAVSKFTISGWMLSTATIGASQYPQFMRNKNSWNEGNGWFAGFEASPTYFNAVGSGGTRTFVTVPFTVYNNWIHLTVAYNGGTVSIYENGSHVQNCGINSVVAGTSQNLTFARSLTGRIDEFRIRDGVEAAAYVAADYKTMNEPGFFEYGAVEPTGLPVYFAPIPAQRIRGAAVEPLVALTNTDSKAELVLDVDYTVAYENNASNGTGRAVVTGRGNYAAYTDVRTFEILPAFEVSIPTQTIMPDGKIPWQSGWVTDAETGAALSDGADYSYVVTVDPANHAGRAVVTGLDDYAGATVTNDFTAKTIIFVGGYTVAEEGTGVTWDSPVSLGNAITMFNAAPDNYGEIWMKSGVYSLTATLAWTFNTAGVVIRGGFAGTENDPAERYPEARTEFNGGGTRNASSGNAPRRVLDLSNSKPVVIDGVDFTCGKRGIQKSGAGALTLLNCAIVDNYTSDEPANNFTGAGLSVYASGAAIVVSNCIVAGNHDYQGYHKGGDGVYIGAAASVHFEDTLFATNGIHWSHSLGSMGEGYDSQTYFGNALSLNGVRGTFRRCRFLCNRASYIGLMGNSGYGCSVYVGGNAGGTVFDHCIFAGNATDACGAYIESGGGFTSSGNIIVNLSSASAEVTFSHCVIAYNRGAQAEGTVGLNIVRGTALIRNSIIARNHNSYSTTMPADMFLSTANAFADVAHTLFTSNVTSSVRSYTAENLTLGPGIIYGDPLFATSYADIKGCMSGHRFAVGKLSQLLAMNLHPLSKAGYVGDDGEWMQSEDQHSPAIDTGNPADPVGAEPDPNGGVVNLGAYGGTAEASKSDSYTLAVQDVAIAFDGDYSQPTVSFTVGGSGSFTASAEIMWSTNRTEWVPGTTLTGLTLGDTPSYALPLYVQPGSMWARVRLHTGKVTSAPADSDETQVTKPLPPWYGKKGPANVVHVRVGAIGAGDGTSWSDAFTTLRAAFAATSAEKNEIWIATNTISLASVEMDVAVGVSSALMVRGGFKGWEEAADERPEGAVSTVDGMNRSVGLYVNNSAAVTVERMRFYRAKGHGFQKGGAGDITLVRCVFDNTSPSGAANGRGLYASGTAGTTLLSAVDCDITDNTTAGSSVSSVGVGAYLQNFRRVTLDGCSFAGNGCVGTPGGYPQHAVKASAVFLSAAPLTARNCKFVANAGLDAQSDCGGAVVLSGDCTGSAMTNCVIACNSDVRSWYDGDGGSNCGGLVVAMGAADRTLDIVNCTIAYNLANGVNSPGGVNVVSGAVTMKNSVVFGNRRWTGTDSGTRHAADVDVKEGASFAADWSLFTADSTNSVDGASGATIVLGVGVVYGDPLFVSDLATVHSWVFTASGEHRRGINFGGNKPLNYLAGRKAINTHLRGARGYFDEKTGELVTDYMTRENVSPAQDAGDPRSDYRGEPDTNDGWHGRRVNMGAWGNTPWATRTKFLHGAVYVR